VNQDFQTCALAQDLDNKRGCLNEIEEAVSLPCRRELGDRAA
jgi:hypothetical protein